MLVTNQNLSTTLLPTVVNVARENPITTVSALTSCAMGAVAGVRNGAKPPHTVDIVSGCMAGLAITAIGRKIPDGISYMVEKASEVKDMIVENPIAVTSLFSSCALGAIPGSYMGLADGRPDLATFAGSIGCAGAEVLAASNLFLGELAYNAIASNLPKISEIKDAILNNPVTTASALASCAAGAVGGAKVLGDFGLLGTIAGAEAGCAYGIGAALLTRIGYDSFVEPKTGES